MSKKKCLVAKTNSQKAIAYAQKGKNLAVLWWVFATLHIFLDIYSIVRYENNNDSFLIFALANIRDFSSSSIFLTACRDL